MHIQTVVRTTAFSVVHGLTFKSISHKQLPNDVWYVIYLLNVRLLRRVRTGISCAWVSGKSQSLRVSLFSFLGLVVFVKIQVSDNIMAP